MRKLIVQEFMTLDGLVSGPGESVEFIAASTGGDQSFGQEQMALMNEVDLILLGRVTYRMFAGYWPNVTTGADKPFAEKLNATPKIVFSRTLQRAPWGMWSDARIVARNATDEIANLKRQPGKGMIIWGSISLAQAVIDEGLMDEYRVVICPAVLGAGRPLFSSNARRMKLVDARTSDFGAVSLKYVDAAGVPALV